MSPGRIFKDIDLSMSIKERIDEEDHFADGGT